MQFSDIPNACELIVASDIHIREPGSDRARILLELIQECHKKSVKNLLLNGDIFDFFYGRSSYFKQKYSAIFNAMQSLSKTCNIIFVEGNHEFGLDRLSLPGIQTVDGYGSQLQLSNYTVQFCHGDMMTYDWKYQLFRSFIRSRIVNFIAPQLPQSLLDNFTNWLAKTSRKKDRYRTLNHERILGAASRILKQVGQKDTTANIFIFGHFHHPYDHVTTDARFLSVPSWDQPNIISIHKDAIQRHFYPV
jgi:UDP-2,3-diacylglucosamine hydrolase